ncbi:MAG TPA: hypothetical protein VFG19_10645 [Geobacteraceae bacterium]|nr:hypothetical protein [Geobacteraceae bacterium]
MASDKLTSSIDAALAQRLQNALIAGEEVIFQVIADPDMEVLRTVLKNPRLDESHLLVLLRRRDLSEDLVRAISRLPQVAESHRLKVAIAYNHNVPGPVFQSFLPNLHLFELVSFCYLPGATADQKLAAERAVLQRLPSTPLGNKITLARRGTATIVGALLREGDPTLTEVCLFNPRLKESDIYSFLNGPTVTAETISAVARNPRWQARLNIKLAVLKNQRTPIVWFSVILPKLPTGEIRKLLLSRMFAGARKDEIEKELKRRGAAR